jgi:hypothetical protein
MALEASAAEACHFRHWLGSLEPGTGCFLRQEILILPPPPPSKHPHPRNTPTAIDTRIHVRRTVAFKSGSNGPTLLRPVLTTVAPPWLSQIVLPMASSKDAHRNGAHSPGPLFEAASKNEAMS